MTDSDDSTALPSEAEMLLREWLGDQWSAEPLTGDASARRYFRLTGPGGEQTILAWYPPSLEGQADLFVRAWNSIREYAPVPRIHRASSRAVLQQDIGNITLTETAAADPARGARLYGRAVDLLIDLQKAPAEAATIHPPFDRSKFRDELQMTVDFYVDQLLGRIGTGREELNRLFDALAERLTTHPYVLCHRDYHGENIHVFNDSLFVIDFQDMRMGPDTYDLASLIRDRGMVGVLGLDLERELLERYASAVGAGAEIWTRYRETLLQRSIKTVGTFARQAIVRGRRHYLDYIPPALESVRFALEGLTEFEELGEVFPLSGSPA